MLRHQLARQEDAAVCRSAFMMKWCYAVLWSFRVFAAMDGKVGVCELPRAKTSDVRGRR